MFAVTAMRRAPRRHLTQGVQSLRFLSKDTQSGHEDVTTNIKAEHNENVVWSDALLSKDERQKFLNATHVGATLWITGLSGSGKSTVGAALEKKLLEMGIHAYRLDGDNIRFGLNKGLGFSSEDREVIQLKHNDRADR